jgi:thiamine biosynthesis lipoprotein
MKQTKLIMSMPITLQINHDQDLLLHQTFQRVFRYFQDIDEKFSPYKPTSQTSRFNQNPVQHKPSKQLKEILQTCYDYERKTNGYFQINYNGIIDPSGLVKSYAIDKAYSIIREHYDDFYLEVGGDIVVSKPVNSVQSWTIGVRNPFELNQIVKTIVLQNGAVATSGNYVKKNHIFNPLNGQVVVNPVSLTVIGQSIIDADVMATAAFAMGPDGVNWLEKLNGLEAYMIESDQQATMTSRFEEYVK